MRDHVTIPGQSIRRVALSLVSIASIAYSQGTIVNPAVQIASSGDLQCINSPLYSTTGNISGVGIAPQIIPVPGTSTNLSLSLIDQTGTNATSPSRDSQLGGYITFYHGQQLLVGAPSGLDLGNRTPACALAFQFVSQTFPDMTSSARPNSTLCGNNIALTLLNSYIRDFNTSSSAYAYAYPEYQRNDTLCSRLATYVDNRISRQSVFDEGLFRSAPEVVKVFGGPLLGPDANTSQYSPPAGDNCQPILPTSYQLHNVLNLSQSIS